MSDYKGRGNRSQQRQGVAAAAVTMGTASRNAVNVDMTWDEPGKHQHRQKDQSHECQAQAARASGIHGSLDNLSRILCQSPEEGKERERHVRHFVIAVIDPLTRTSPIRKHLGNLIGQEDILVMLLPFTVRFQNKF